MLVMVTSCTSKAASAAVEHATAAMAGCAVAIPANMPRPRSGQSALTFSIANRFFIILVFLVILIVYCKIYFSSSNILSGFELVCLVGIGDEAGLNRVNHA